MHEEDWDGLGRRFGRERGKRALQRNEDRYLAANQFGDQHRQPVVLALSPAVFDCNVPTLCETGVIEAAMKCGEIRASLFDRRQVNKADDRHRRLLRARGERPSSRRTAEQGDELAPLHSITSSARASRIRG